MILFGTHGTSKSKAQQILRTGFLLGKGRHGRGVYLWASTSEKDGVHETAIELAEHYVQCMPHLYRGDNDSSPSVLLCEVHTSPENFLDIESHYIGHAFREYVKKMRPFLNDTSKGSEKERASKVADDFVHLMEETAKVTYDVIHTKTSVPESLRPRPAAKVELWLGLAEAGCYIVKRTNCLPQGQITPIRR